MMVINQERVCEFCGIFMQVYGGGMFIVVNFYVYVLNFIIDVLVIVYVILKGENFVYDGMFILVY